MARIEETVHVAAPPAAVWAVVADPARLGDWLTMHQGWVGDPPTGYAAGQTTTARVVLAAIPATVIWTIDRFDAPTALAFSGQALGQVDVAIGLDLAPDGDGSTLTITADLTGPLLAGPLGEAVDRAGHAELARSLERLRPLVEP
jgi:carbon monoxide dehydrogenase subunit G